MRSGIHSHIDAVERGQWNALAGTHIPFLRHEFLSALELTGCIGARTGWEPRYFTLVDEAGLAAAVPAFVKMHSYGEFVFDFAWAQAYARVGGHYYPKLTIAVPFTPATGPRLLIRAGADPGCGRRLLEEVTAYARAEAFSSVHALFLDEPARSACARAGWLLRRDCQFHWMNRGYSSFDDYLGTFTAQKRKKVRRERRRVAEDGIRFETRFGGELDRRLLDRIYALHRDTFLRHGHEPYLSRAFFGEIARSLPEQFMVKIALHGSEPVAAAVFFWCQEALFGRYWGAAADFHSLHFEACYHQGIEFCIERQIARFEPGTQGEHKVSRGFEPALTWSAHFIRDARLRQAIGAFLEREGESVDEYAQEVQAHVPYRAAPDEEA
ncbi:MAG TPA: peptidogalycan biosysnthesis protein [Steroidobacteraceae bacterium]|jgi:predicted N-acyltransferase|nr:peptidogalycan biosysnthesis protein [Steroidobacteraceae bacterium]